MGAVRQGSIERTLADAVGVRLGDDDILADERVCELLVDGSQRLAVAAPGAVTMTAESGSVTGRDASRRIAATAAGLVLTYLEGTSHQRRQGQVRGRQDASVSMRPLHRPLSARRQSNGEGTLTIGTDHGA